MIAPRRGWLALTLVALASSSSASPPNISAMTRARLAMVKGIEADIHRAASAADNADLARALDAMARVPREEFVAPAQRKQAYRPRPLPIGYGQTISAAYIVAVMTAALRLPAHANVLDVGTGSGYQAAVLSLLADHVSSVEIVAPLAASAGARLARLGYRNVEVRAGDGYAGWPDHAPFDGIVVAAGAAEIPQPLIDQLKVGGRLVMPIGPSWANEQLIVLTKTAPDQTTRCSLGWTMFVDFTGRGARDENASGVMKFVPPCYDAPIARLYVVRKGGRNAWR